MGKHAEIARTVLGCALWSLALVAAAQDKQPENQPAAPQGRAQGLVESQEVESTPGDQLAGSEKPANPADSGNQVPSSVFAKFRQQVEEQRANLHAELADPRKRARLMATRTEWQRAANPDLATLLKLDRGTADRLLALLAEQQLSRDLVSPSDDVASHERTARRETERYTQHMAEIGQLLGATRFDDYVDYQLVQSDRMSVRQFSQGLPVRYQLTLEQRVPLVDLFHQQRRGTYQDIYLAPSFIFFSYDQRRMSQEELKRVMRLNDIAMSEWRLAALEAADREMVDQAASILSPEQLKALTEWKQQQSSQRRDGLRDQRRELGSGPKKSWLCRTCTSRCRRRSPRTCDSRSISWSTMRGWSRNSSV